MRKTIIILFLLSSINASVKPNFQLTGKKLPPNSASEVTVLMNFPNDENSYQIIGTMSDCSSFSKYQEFVSVFKTEAAKYGANKIVINNKSPGTNSSQFDGGMCVEATAIYYSNIKQNITPQQSQSQNQEQGNSTPMLLEIIRLQRLVDSLRVELDKAKKNSECM